MSKATLAKWLLLSLIPVGISVLILILLITATNGAEPSGSWAGLFVLLTLYFPIALVSGLVLHFWTHFQANRMFHASQRYAELHGWLPISHTQWRNRKRNTILLSVTKALTKNTYILTIEIEGESIVVDEFETSTWALQFGDWLWEQLLTDTPQITREVVVEKRAEWEQTTALALRR